MTNPNDKPRREWWINWCADIQLGESQVQEDPGEGWEHVVAMADVQPLLDALEDVRSELSSPRPDDHWCIDQIEQAIAKWNGK